MIGLVPPFILEKVGQAVAGASYYYKIARREEAMRRKMMPVLLCLRLKWYSIPFVHEKEVHGGGSMI
jgi:hypothetical protein